MSAADFSQKVTPFPLTRVEQTQPMALEEEERLCACLLSNPDAIALVAHKLKPEQFYGSQFRYTYEACQSLFSEGRTTDLMAVFRWLSDRKLIEQVGGKSGLSKLLDHFELSHHAESYARVIVEKWERRQMVAAALKAIEIAKDAPEWESARSEAQKLFFDLMHSSDNKNSYSFSELKDLHFEEMLHRGEQSGRISIPTGFYDLDKMTSGLNTGLIVIAGRPAMGKSAFAANVARNVLVDAKMPILLFSLEMSAMQVFDRLMAYESNTTAGDMKKATVRNWDDYNEALFRLGNTSGVIDQSAAVGIADIQSKGRRLTAAYGQLGAIVIDYLQLMQMDGENPVHEIGKITRSLKVLSGELNCPVILLSQLSRAVEERNNKRPMMSDLRSCLTGDTLLFSECGGRIPISQVRPGQKVLAVDARQKTVWAQVSKFWEKGVKPVFRLETSTGRVIRATANHPFFTQRGYVKLDEIREDDLIGCPFRINPDILPKSIEDPRKARLLGYMIGNGSMIHGLNFVTPCDVVKDDFIDLVSTFFPGSSFNIEKRPGCWDIDVAYHHREKYGKPFGNPLRNWLRSLGLVGKRSYEKFVPDWVFSLDVKGAANFLAGLLYTDGSIKNRADRCDIVAVDTSSPQLARDVLALMAYVGVAAIVGSPGKCSQVHHHPMYRVSVLQSSILDYAVLIPPIGRKGEKLLNTIEYVLNNPPQPAFSPNNLPVEVSELLHQKSLILRKQGIKKSHDGLRVWRHQGKRLNRQICTAYADVLQDQELLMWAESDLLWESVRSIEPDGNEPVYDICVPDTGNFVANGITVHNSGAIEQDADLILMLYRDEYYNPDTIEKGVSEVIISKQRNGPTGTVKLLFEPEYTRFRNMKRHDSM
jgi:replicative DNA helicase